MREGDRETVTSVVYRGMTTLKENKSSKAQGDKLTTINVGGSRGSSRNKLLLKKVPKKKGDVLVS